MRKQYIFPLDLLIILVWTILTFISVLAPFLSETFIKTILVIPVVLFIPGYLLTAALFPGKNDLKGVERVVLSFGLSIALVPLLGLLLNFTFGIKLFPVLLTLYIYIIVLVITAAYRRDKVPEKDRYTIELYNFLYYINEDLFYLFNPTKSRTDIILTIILIFSIVLAIGTLIYVITTPKIGERFTEFYILGSGGKTEKYPFELKYNSPASVLVGVVNQEYKPLSYTFEIVLNNKVLNNTVISLDHNETWERNITFVPESYGTDMKLEFLLFKENNLTAPYRELHLWVNVSGAEEKYTEFYIPGHDSKAGNYTSRLKYNTLAAFPVGVVNHEQTSLNYTLEVMLNKKVIGKTTMKLKNNEVWERNITVLPGGIGTDMKFEFLLFKENDRTAPYREIFLLVNVTK